LWGVRFGEEGVCAEPAARVRGGAVRRAGAAPHERAGRPRADAGAVRGARRRCCSARRHLLARHACRSRYRSPLYLGGHTLPHLRRPPCYMHLRTVHYLLKWQLNTRT
jgi:hypothetical protein